MIRNITLAVVACVVVAGAGCGAVTDARNAAKKQQMSNNLKQVGIAYHNFVDSNAKAPTGWSDLASVGLPPDVQQQLSAYTVHWGTNFRDVTIGTSDFVLAYPPDASTAGGQVLMLDGAVRQVTAQEFNDLLAAQTAPGAVNTPAQAGGAAPEGTGIEAPAP